MQVYRLIDIRFIDLNELQLRNYDYYLDLVVSHKINNPIKKSELLQVDCLHREPCYILFLFYKVFPFIQFTNISIYKK